MASPPYHKDTRMEKNLDTEYSDSSLRPHQVVYGWNPRIVETQISNESFELLPSWPADQPEPPLPPSSSSSSFVKRLLGHIHSKSKAASSSSSDANGETTGNDEHVIPNAVKLLAINSRQKIQDLYRVPFHKYTVYNYTELYDGPLQTYHIAVLIDTVVNNTFCKYVEFDVTIESDGEKILSNIHLSSS